MTPITSLTVTVKMRDGELRAGLELRAVTERDGIELAEMIDTAKHRDLYDEEMRILQFNGLCGYHLYWPGLGIRNRSAFEEIPRGNWANGRYFVLFMSNPNWDREEQDDLSEKCLCQDDHSCQLCRLQKRVRTAEVELLEYQNARTSCANSAEKGVNSTRKHEQHKIFKKSQSQDGEREEQEDDEDQVQEEAYGYQADEFERDEGDHPTSLQQALHRAQTAERANDKLLRQIALLKRYISRSHKRLPKARESFSSPITEMTVSIQSSQTDDDISGGSHSIPDHPQYRRGGKVQPGNATISKAQNAEKMGEAKDRKINDRGGNAETMRDLKKTSNKRRHDTFDEDEVEDENNSDKEPRYESYHAIASSRDGACDRGKTGQKISKNTCRPQKVAKRKDEESSDESELNGPKPGPTAWRPGMPREACRVSALSQANQPTAKSGRRTNNSQASFLDAVGLHSSSSGPKNNLNRLAADNGTSSTKNAIIDNESDDKSSDISQASTVTFSFPDTTLNAAKMANPAQTAVPSTAIVGANPVQAAATSRKAKGWTNTELQALITLVRAHRNAPVGQSGERPEILHDARLFELMSIQLRAHGINRSAGACKNEWNRRGRQASGIDNRKVANPDRMVTSLQ